MGAIASIYCSLACVFVLQKSPQPTGGRAGGPTLRTARIVLPTLPASSSDFAWSAQSFVEVSLADGLDAGTDQDGMPLYYPYKVGNISCDLGKDPDGSGHVECFDQINDLLGGPSSGTYHFTVILRADNTKASLYESSMLGRKLVYSVEAFASLIREPTGAGKIWDIRAGGTRWSVGLIQ